ncbi:ribonuclease R [Candidatus Izemoplasma sp. B36]|uniref:ribonuclease R n=1 Tax=Candidatus Izemoplasma sp. B36 TaxID=3242468 RepID=UPI00355718B2
MKKEVYNKIKKSSYKDRTLISLAGLLHIDSEEGFNKLNKALYSLTKESKILRDKDGHYNVIQSKDFVKGKFDLKYKGYGFIIVDDETHPDIFIPKTEKNTAMDQDYCLVEITREKARGKLEGRIIKVLERNITHVVGEYYNEQIFPKNYDNDVVYKLRKEDRKKVTNHQLIKAKITRYGRTFIKECGLVEILGSVDDKDIEIKEVIARHNLLDKFTSEELDYARSINQEVDEADIKNRIDLRTETIFTIDGEYTKDIDDAVSIKKKNDNYILGVHIADVSYYVKEDSVLDKCAYNRGTSVYLANSVIPMLPKELSNGICSLNPRVDRFTQTCEMEITKKGEVINYSIYPSIINSKYKMTYTNVNKILENDEEITKEYADIASDIMLMGELRQILSNVREKMGSINFETIEPKFIFDDDGSIKELKVRERQDAEKLIEEFMLVANQVVATHVFNMKLPFIYRIHELPNQEKLSNIVKMLERFGYSEGLDDNTTQFNLQTILKKVEGTLYEKVINMLLLRSMAKARYAMDNVGHYGLAFDNYTHFTSPIRRYPDLIVHRFLRKYVFNNNKSYDDETKAKLDDISKQTSKTEREAMICEREVMDMKKAEYMEQFINQEFTGIISSVMKFGMFVELPNTVEGLVHISTFDEDMEYDETNLMLIGNYTKKQYNIGEEVKVKLVKVNRLLGKIDFELI